jgi:hypothetical protein
MVYAPKGKHETGGDTLLASTGDSRESTEINHANTATSKQFGNPLR